ncbi:zinc-binding oxidoreductase ToxD [Punctularia strigosozonata HHB-11173 SS5]|uniref:zinc-binding oxidoreductase ToxD n=1 Tax=Punctularia strigosozonata (strain HHB-11173) TaxID=741275 RepID=UPI0004418016|nr:zinc-binding oxidoreductase ToxD [Punctularia strigosozonata HHB-11173 SS5]EIN07977.1 zinc-binding oxidoreductase ToxD [Punctularia strigosozonata HHB-11173 SS5]
MRALVILEGHTTAVKEVPTPKPDAGEILVKVVAVAQNPTDWKHVEMVTDAGVIVGCDFAGDVVQLTEGVKGWKVGDRVSGFVHGSQYHDRGSFAEYLKVDHELAWHIPDGVSYEEAATANVGFFTAVQTLFHPKNLGLVGYPDKVPAENASWVLVFSGATSVGLYAIQLLHIVGYRVVTTTSAKNFELVKSLGADVAVDYRDADVSKKIQDATGNTLSFALDTIATAETQEASVKAFGPGPAKLITIQPVQDSAKAVRDDVEFKATLLYTAAGRAFKTSFGWELPAIPEDRQQVAEWLPKITELFQHGKVKPNPVKFWPGGLDAIKDGFEYMKSGKLSAEKIVYRI